MGRIGPDPRWVGFPAAGVYPRSQRSTTSQSVPHTPARRRRPPSLPLSTQEHPAVPGKAAMAMPWSGSSSLATPCCWKGRCSHVCYCHGNALQNQPLLGVSSASASALGGQHLVVGTRAAAVDAVAAQADDLDARAAPHARALHAPVAAVRAKVVGPPRVRAPAVLPAAEAAAGAAAVGVVPAATQVDDDLHHVHPHVAGHPARGPADEARTETSGDAAQPLDVVQRDDLRGFGGGAGQELKTKPLGAWGAGCMVAWGR